MFIGNRLKELRKAKGISLTELATNSGVQIATLSRIEHCKMTGSLGSHINIAKALGIDVTELYTHIIREGGSEKAQKPRIIRDIFVHTQEAASEILTPQIFNKKMLPILIKLEPKGQSAKEEHKDGTEKFIYILEGNITVHLGEQTYPLSKGNSLYFESNVIHQITNTGKSPARILCVVTPMAL